MKKFFITISGDSAAGKSTIAKKLKTFFNIPHISVGDLQREQAKEIGMNIEEYQDYIKDHPEIDHKLDNDFIKFAQTYDAAIFEGRLSGWVLHNEKIPSFKIFITAKQQTRAFRRAKQEKLSEEKALRNLRERDKKHTQRFKDIYNIDINDRSIYNLVIFTDYTNPKQIFKEILANLKEFYPDHPIWQKK